MTEPPAAWMLCFMSDKALHFDFSFHKAVTIEPGLFNHFQSLFFKDMLNNYRVYTFYIQNIRLSISVQKVVTID